MAWYWVLLIVVGCQGLFLLMFWLLTRNKAVSYNAELDASASKRLEEELAAEKALSAELKEHQETLATKLKALGVWYNANVNRIEKEASDAFTAMAGDPSDVDIWLDSFKSSTSTTADETRTEELPDEERG